MARFSILVALPGGNGLWQWFTWVTTKGAIRWWQSWQWQWWWKMSFAFGLPVRGPRHTGQPVMVGWDLDEGVYCLSQYNTVCFFLLLFDKLAIYLWPDDDHDPHLQLPQRTWPWLHWKIRLGGLISSMQTVNNAYLFSGIRDRLNWQHHHHFHF